MPLSPLGLTDDAIKLSCWCGRSCFTLHGYEERMVSYATSYHVRTKPLACWRKNEDGDATTNINEALMAITVTDGGTLAKWVILIKVRYNSIVVSREDEEEAF